MDRRPGHWSLATANSLETARAIDAIAMNSALESTEPVLPAAIAIAVVGDLLKQLDDANPDVGLGPSRQFFIEKAKAFLGLSSASISKKDVEFAAADKSDRGRGALILAVKHALELRHFAGSRLPAKYWNEEIEPVLTEALHIAKAG